MSNVKSVQLVRVCCAVVASNTAVSDENGARRLGRASIAMSVTGIVVTVVVVIVVVAWIVPAMISSTFYIHSCPYTYDGTCYTYKKYVGIFSECT